MIGALSWCGCSHSRSLESTPTHQVFGYVGQRVVYVLTNLHPDPFLHRLYSVNYQQGGLIPRCTPVHLQYMDRHRLQLVRLDNHQRYDYVFHPRSLGEPLDAHLAHYFGPNCDAMYPQTLGAVDQGGIAMGIVTLGMTKAGVVAALGYPPAHKTPSLQADRWIYWRSRFDKMAIEFRDGLVSSVVD